MSMVREGEPTDEVAGFKRRARSVWAAGDYPAVARHIWEVGGHLVQRVAVQPGEDVLDVACGTGNAAIPAAVAGARVTGVDLTPELFDAGRELAAAAGVEVTWREGDAEALPWADDTFDVVLSTFGCMFAPRHGVASREIARVLRPGGRVGICSWTPDGPIGGFFAVVGKHLPPPPEFASPPPLWGDETHVREIFYGTGVDLEFERHVVDLRFGSVPEIVEFYSTKFGPIVAARELLEPTGGWPALLADLRTYFEHNIEARDGGIVWPADYLLALGRKSVS